MKRITRRDFVKGSMVAGAAVLMPYARVLGANEDVRVAVVGMRSQGAGHISRFLEIPGVRVVALCDADQAILDREVKKIHDRNEKVDAYTDVRKLLEDKNIDAISTATPNHWHALVTIWACQAGKDVYVEKPVCHNIWEGRKMVEAARKYNRIVQAGTQSRSSGALRDAFDYIKQGNLGRILLVRGLCYKPRGSIGKVDGPQPIPETVDYDLWCGPAPKGPLMRKSLHYDWHWVWPTGNGDIGNQGIHQMDVCRWAIGQSKLAPRVMSIGGRFGYLDDGETPNTQITILDYQPAPIIFEVRGLPRRKDDSAMDHYRGTRVGVVIQCEQGYYASDETGGGWAYDNEGKKIKQFAREGAGDHQANFIKAVRSRKVSDLNADIYEGYISSALCHMANISHRLGKQADRDKILEAIRGNSDMVETFERFQEHLLVNGVDLQQTPRMQGPWLTMDADQEKFIGEFAEEANKLVTRDYRAPFVVPEQV